MHNFDHPHIIKLIGICSDYPCFIVMELARLGQLKKYLQANMGKIEISTLIFYCYQLNTAMSYLESKNFVHRYENNPFNIIFYQLDLQFFFFILKRHSCTQCSCINSDVC